MDGWKFRNRSRAAYCGRQVARKSPRLRGHALNKRLVDQRQPVYWGLAQFFSGFRRGQWESRDLPDKTRVAIRLSHYQPQLNFIFHHNAKAASTTTVRLLWKLLARRRGELPHSLSGEDSKLLSGPEHWRAILPRLEDPTLYRFSFVRHPVARAVSTFNNFFVETQNAYTRRHKFTRRTSGLRLRDPSLENFDRFLDFSEEVMAASPDLCDLHIRSQRRNLLTDQLRYNYIGRMEAFEEGISEVLGHIGLARWLDPGDLTKRENASRTSERLRTPSDAQLERIYTMYREDFDTFGYEVGPVVELEPGDRGKQ